MRFKGDGSPSPGKNRQESARRQNCDCSWHESQLRNGKLADLLGALVTTKMAWFDFPRKVRLQRRSSGNLAGNQFLRTDAEHCWRPAFSCLTILMRRHFTENCWILDMPRTTNQQSQQFPDLVHLLPLELIMVDGQIEQACYQGLFLEQKE